MEAKQKKILFRASQNGRLMTSKPGTTFSEANIRDLETLNEKVLSGKTLTENQRTSLAELKDKKKKSAIPQLSDGAKQYVREMWLWHEKGIKTEIKSKYLEKGIWAEEDSISLISEVDDQPYKKNTEQRDNGVICGMCDVFFINEFKKRIVIDTKSSWNAETFMTSKPSIENEWQGDSYMELWDADEFHLKFCLVDCPAHIYAFELYKFKSKHNMIDETTPENKEKLEQFRRTLIYSDNPSFSAEERVKTFIFKRDPNKIIQMYDKIKLGLEYYPTITLNGLNVEP